MLLLINTLLLKNGLKYKSDYFFFFSKIKNNKTSFANEAAPRYIARFTKKSINL